MEGSSLVQEDPSAERCIWNPGHEEAEDHEDAHACHFLLSFLGGLGLLLLGCSLERSIKLEEINKIEEVDRLKNVAKNVAYSFDGQHQTSVSEKDEEDGNKEVNNEHVDDI